MDLLAMQIIPFLHGNGLALLAQEWTRPHAIVGGLRPA